MAVPPLSPSVHTEYADHFEGLPQQETVARDAAERVSDVVHLFTPSLVPQRSAKVVHGLRCVGPRYSFILPGLVSMGAQRVERSKPSLVRSSPASVAATSRFGHVEPLLASDTVGVGAGPLEQAIQTGSSASIGDAQPESESSGREVPLPARDRASELPESTVESHTPGDAAQATPPVVWAPRQGSPVPSASGGPPPGLEHPSAPPPQSGA